MKGFDLGDGVYTNTGGAPESPFCNASPAENSGPAVGTYEWATGLQQRLDDELTRLLALRGADLIRVVATTQPAETQSRLKDSADGIERLCSILDKYQRRDANARSAVRQAIDKIGALNAKLEEVMEEGNRLRAQLDEAKRLKRARRGTAKA